MLFVIDHFLHGWHCRDDLEFPVYKKDDKLKKSCLILPLPVFGKMFEKLTLNNMFNFFIKNYLILPNQSGFKPGDCCINELLSLTDDIYKSFDCVYHVRGVSLDI